MQNPTSILITGASSGIGEGLARYYAGPGIKLAISGRDEQRLASVCRDLQACGAEVVAKVIDVVDKAAMHAWIEELDQRWQLDLVIANAGVSIKSHEVEGLATMTEQTFAINVSGVFHTIHPALARMSQRGRGQVVIISSLAGLMGMASSPSYSASKNAVRAYGEALRGAYADSGVEVNVVCPGFIVSRLTQKNTFPMPMIMDVDKAARHIARGLANNKARIAFPWPMYYALRFFQLLPIAVSEWLLTKLPKKS